MTARAEHLIRTPIVELLAQLDPAFFVQVHRSTIVNLAMLAGTRRDEARLFLRISQAEHRTAGEPRLRAPVQGHVSCRWGSCA
jgi:DNA-binding LytR/AlgR family response regulator